jgi:pyruvate dehydrogenase E1 component alpha subunit
LTRQGIGQEFFDECDAAGVAMAEEIRAQIFAMPSPPIENMFKHVYSEPHPVIDEQLAWLKGYEASFGAPGAAETEGAN